MSEIANDSQSTLMSIRKQERVDILVRRELVKELSIIFSEHLTDGSRYRWATTHPLFAMDNDCAYLTAVATHELPDCFGVLPCHQNDTIHEGSIIRLGIVEL